MIFIDEEGLYKCDVCTSIFKTKDEAIKHLKENFEATK